MSPMKGEVAMNATTQDARPSGPEIRQQVFGAPTGKPTAPGGGDAFLGPLADTPPHTTPEPPATGTPAHAPPAQGGCPPPDHRLGRSSRRNSGGRTERQPPWKRAVHRALEGRLRARRNPPAHTRQERARCIGL